MKIILALACLLAIDCGAQTTPASKPYVPDVQPADRNQKANPDAEKWYLATPIGHSHDHGPLPACITRNGDSISITECPAGTVPTGDSMGDHLPARFVCSTDETCKYWYFTPDGGIPVGASQSKKPSKGAAK